MVPVKCECGTLFGMVRDDNVLVIKYRDLIRYVSGNVAGPCRKCGATVVWPSENVRPTVIGMCDCSICAHYRQQASR